MNISYGSPQKPALMEMGVAEDAKHFASGKKVGGRDALLRVFTAWGKRCVLPRCIGS